MFYNQKITPYIFAFLAFCVVSSKHIIIYNEEILVFLSFFLFVTFVSYYFGNNIKDSLDERSKAIQSELQNFLILKKDCLNELFEQYEKVSFSKKVLQNLTNFTNLQLKNKSKNSEKFLKNKFSQQINFKLKSLSYSILNLKNKLQQIISNILLTNVLIKSKKSNLRNKNELNFDFLKQNIQSLFK